MPHQPLPHVGDVVNDDGIDSCVLLFLDALHIVVEAAPRDKEKAVGFDEGHELRALEKRVAAGDYACGRRERGGVGVWRFGGVWGLGFGVWGLGGGW